MELKDLSLIKRVNVGLKALTTAIFPTSGSGNVVRTYTSFAEWDRALYGDSSALDYSREIGDPLSSSLVMAAVRWVGNNLPEAPIKVMEGSDAKGDSQVVEDHDLVRLLRRPNPFYSGATLWKAFAASWVVDGNVYLLKIRTSGRQVTELWYVPHGMIKPRWPDDGSTFISHYAYEVEGKEYRIEREDVIHFRDGVDPENLRRGLSPLYALWRELYGDVAAATYAAKVARNFGVPPFVLSPKPDQSGYDVDIEAIKASLMRSITGDNTGKPLVLSSAFDVKELGGKPRDMDMKTQHRIPEERVAAVMGIPAIVLGFGAGLDRSTYSNMEQAEEHAYESYLLPLHRYIEEELNVQLLPDLDTKPNRYVSHDLSKVRALQEDEDAKHKRVQGDFVSGIVDLAEARSALGYPIKPGQEDFYSPKAGAAPVPEEEQDDEDEDNDNPFKSLNPTAKEIEEAVEWWEKVAPKEARELIHASNGDSEVLSG